MNQKNVLIAFAIIVIAALAFWFSTSSMVEVNAPTSESTAPTSTTPSKTTGTTPKAPSPIKGGSTFTSVLTQKGNYECDYEQVEHTGQGHNVIYISGGKMRAEFRNISGDVQAGSLSVYDGHYLYAWQEGKSVGTKTVITSLGQLPAAIPQDLTSGRIYGTAYESVGWKCHTWLVDKSLLVPPSYVVFK